MQPRISSSTEVICRCRHFNGTNNTTTTAGNVLDDELDSNTDDTTTTTANNTTTNADTTTSTNANTNAINNDDEWDVDIQNLKIKYTQALKRKELEMEKVAGEISNLRKKLRYLEDMERL